MPRPTDLSQNIFYEKFHSMFDLLQNNNTLDLEGNYRSSIPMTKNLDMQKGKESTVFGRQCLHNALKNLKRICFRLIMSKA